MPGRCTLPFSRNLRVLVVGGEMADERRVALAAVGTLEADVAGVDLLVAPDADVVVLEVNGIPGWQALQSVGDHDLTELVVSACEALASRV